MHAVVGAKNNIMTLSLENPRVEFCGCVVVSAEEQKAGASNEIVEFVLNADLPEMEPNAASQGVRMCFFVIQRQIAETEYTPIYKSEVCRGESTENFFWNKIKLSCANLC